MNIDELMESLSGNAPDTDHVLASLRRKRRAARNRMYAASGGLAVVVLAVAAGVLLHGATTGSGTAAESSPANGAAVPAAGGAGGLSQNGLSSRAATIAGGAQGCSDLWLQIQLAEAVRKGASVIVGYGSLTPGSAAQGTGSHSPAYYSVTLRSVRTLAGPAVMPGSIAWITVPGVGVSAGSATASPRQPAFSPGGEVFGIVSSPATAGAPGPVLMAAPVTNGQVLLAGPGCWDITAAGQAFGFASTPTLHVPQPPRAEEPITKVPLATAEKLAAQS
jgi:hypothetical protein